MTVHGTRLKDSSLLFLEPCALYLAPAANSSTIFQKLEAVDNPRNPSPLMGEGKGGGGKDGEYSPASLFPPPLYPLPPGEGKAFFGQSDKPLGNVQKCSHGLRQKGSLAASRTSDRAEVFSGVTGGRAPSFHDLSVGEAPAPSAREGNGGGGKFPSQVSRRKDQPGRLGTQEMVPALSRYGGPMQTLLNVTNPLTRR